MKNSSVFQVEPFMHPVDRTMFPDYDKYVVHAMDLNLMKQHITDGMYGSTEAFLSDAQWILHNSIIFNTCENCWLFFYLIFCLRFCGHQWTKVQNKLTNCFPFIDMSKNNKGRRFLSLKG